MNHAKTPGGKWLGVGGECTLEVGSVCRWGGECTLQVGSGCGCMCQCTLQAAKDMTHSWDTFIILSHLR